MALPLEERFASSICLPVPEATASPTDSDTACFSEIRSAPIAPFDIWTAGPAIAGRSSPEPLRDCERAPISDQHLRSFSSHANKRIEFLRHRHPFRSRIDCTYQFFSRTCRYPSRHGTPQAIIRIGQQPRTPHFGLAQALHLREQHPADLLGMEGALDEEAGARPRCGLPINPPRLSRPRKSTHKRDGGEGLPDGSVGDVPMKLRKKVIHCLGNAHLRRNRYVPFVPLGTNNIRPPPPVSQTPHLFF